MIIVIADDLSGAAEIAGIGLRYGLEVEMSTHVTPSLTAELLVVSTDTRSMDESDAVEEIKRVTEEVVSVQPDLLFKKIDSVLRGHVIAEIQSQLKILGRDKALVAAANPSLERTISNGRYFYKGEPIHKSSFAHDPEFNIKSSEVLKMLRSSGDQVTVIRTGEEIPEPGIYIGEVKSLGDLKYWACKVDESFLPAGGSDFFSALLEKAGNKKVEQELTGFNASAGPVLFVSGTTFTKSREAIKEIKSNGGPVSYMPRGLITTGDPDPEITQLWSSEITAFIHSTGKVIIAIDGDMVSNGNKSARLLRDRMALVVNNVLQEISITEVAIEGGATADAIIRKAGFTRFLPVQEFARGVVRMKVKEHDLFITIKPGSYDWPAEVWGF